MPHKCLSCLFEWLSTNNFFGWLFLFDFSCDPTYAGPYNFTLSARPSVTHNPNWISHKLHSLQIYYFCSDNPRRQWCELVEGFEPPGWGPFPSQLRDHRPGGQPSEGGGKAGQQAEVCPVQRRSWGQDCGRHSASLPRNQRGQNWQRYYTKLIFPMHKWPQAKRSAPKVIIFFSHQVSVEFFWEKERAGMDLLKKKRIMLSFFVSVPFLGVQNVKGIKTWNKTNRATRKNMKTVGKRCVLHFIFLKVYLGLRKDVCSNHKAKYQKYLLFFFTFPLQSCSPGYW